MASPRYIAEAFIFPKFLAAQGVHKVLDAIERRDADFFIPVWMEAGFRFTPMLFHEVFGTHRIGVIGFPMPRESTESYLGIIVGSTTEPAARRYLTWELATPLGFPGETGTMIGEWNERGHGNCGPGPRFTADPVTDLQAILDRIHAIL
jgi:hypothetical protein